MQGAGGGPTEDNVTGLLVHSTSLGWEKGSLLAVDAGIHLAAIIKILEEHIPGAVVTPPSPPRSTKRNSRGAIHRLSHSSQSNPNPVSNGVPGSPGLRPDVNKPKRTLTSGPFTDLDLRYESAGANAAFILQHLIPTYLISHPHLDHVSGFAVNTASFQFSSGAKRLAALPSTIDAIKTHIFNDVVWPNMSDEDDGIGFVSYMRLVEGGNSQFGDAQARGYIEVCEGLQVKCWSVSHGCYKPKAINGHGSNGEVHHHHESRAITPPGDVPLSRSHSFGHAHHAVVERKCPIDSTAFFLRDTNTGREILIFGDVEPDFLSISPRNSRVWADAAPKIVSGSLAGIFIECSYADEQPDDMLFGHFKPQHLANELRNLAELVVELRGGSASSTTADESNRKRKRESNGFPQGLPGGIGPLDELPDRRSRSTRSTRRRKASSVSPATRSSLSVPTAQLANSSIVSNDGTGNTDRRSSNSTNTALTNADHQQVSSLSSLHPNNNSRNSTSAMSTTSNNDDNHRRSSNGVAPASSLDEPLPLKGLKVVIIHVKDNLRDGPKVGDTILEQLHEHEKGLGLGVEYRVSKTGESIWL